MPLSLSTDEPGSSGERDIDVIARRLIKHVPNLIAEQLKVTHPADDDGLWFFYLPFNRDDEIQVESSSGMCPFLIESCRNDDRTYANTVDEVVKVLIDHFRSVAYVSHEGIE